MIPIFVAAGTGVASQASGSPQWPTHQIDDIALLFVETADQAVTLTDAQGFVQLSDSTGAPGGGNLSFATRLTVFWCRATSAAMGAPTIADAGNHIIARILTFRGCVQSGDPWDVLAEDAIDTPSTNFSIPGSTTTVDDCLVVAAVSNAVDQAAPSADGWTNADLTDLVEFFDYQNAIGNGGGWAVAGGGKAAAGAYGATTGTLVTTSRQDLISIALKGLPEVNDFAADIVVAAARTTTGLQDFTFTGIETPRAAIVINAINTAEGQTPEAIVSVGLACFSPTLTLQRNFATFRIRDNKTTLLNTAGRVTDDDQLVWLMDPTFDPTTSQTSIREANISRFKPNAVELDWTVASGTAHLVACIALAGRGIRTYAAAQTGLNGTTGATSTISGVGFEPELLLLTSGLEIPTGDLGHKHHGGLAIGAAKNSGAGDVVQRNAYMSGRVNSTIEGAGEAVNGEPYARFSTERIHHNRDFQAAAVYQWDADTFGADGWRFVSSGGDGVIDDGSNFLALNLASPLKARVGTLTTPTTTGSHTLANIAFEPDIDFTPDFMLLVATKAAAEDTDYDDSVNGEVMAIIAITASKICCVSWANQRGANPTNCHTTIKSTAIDIDNGDGTALWDATLTGFVAGGVTLNFTATDSTARKWMYLAIGQGTGEAGNPVNSSHETPDEWLSQLAIINFVANVSWISSLSTANYILNADWLAKLSTVNYALNTEWQTQLSTVNYALNTEWISTLETANSILNLAWQLNVTTVFITADDWLLVVQGTESSSIEWGGTASIQLDSTININWNQVVTKDSIVPEDWNQDLAQVNFTVPIVWLVGIPLATQQINIEWAGVATVQFDFIVSVEWVGSFLTFDVQEWFITRPNVWSVNRLNVWSANNLQVLN